MPGVQDGSGTSHPRLCAGRAADPLAGVQLRHPVANTKRRVFHTAQGAVVGSRGREPLLPLVTPVFTSLEKPATPENAHEVHLPFFLLLQYEISPDHLPTGGRALAILAWAWACLTANFIQR